MLLPSGLDLPPELVNSQANGTLVVFAGAGVSCDPPSNLPLFSALARQVVHGTSLEPDEGEPPDRFLARAKDFGVDVHACTKAIIGNGLSQPNELHRLLVGLFSSERALRIVTTNYDMHLSEAAAEAFDKDVEIYAAPALPLGRGFEGVVNLHGRVDRDPTRLVVTANDFGRAYLTEGWATRFLADMFRAYTVLFVGYKHEDVVLNYLARGLPPGTRRFAFAPEDTVGRWKELGITCISYPLWKGPDEHGALRIALKDWVARTKMGSLEHEAWLQDIVSKDPRSLNPEESDYLRGAITDPTLVKFVTRHTNSPEWLRWADSQGALDLLFDSQAVADPVADTLAGWFAERHVCCHVDDALQIFVKHGQRLSPVLWMATARDLGNPSVTKAGGSAAKWTPVLLATRPPNAWNKLLSYLVVSLDYEVDAPTIRLLFHYLTQPVLVLERDFSFQGDVDALMDGVKPGVSLLGELHHLAEAWQKLLLPHIEHEHHWVLPLLSARLAEAHQLLRSHGRVDEWWDPVSWHRTAIEPHSQDQLPQALDPLVDWARDCVAWVAANQGNAILGLADTWVAGGIPLLRRLAVFAIGASCLPDDEKVQWTLDRDLVFAPGLKHEVFQLLAAAYPACSDTTKRQVLRRAGKGPKARPGRRLPKKTREYEAYNLLYWLSKADPGSELTQARFNKSGEGRDFIPRPHPDLDFYMGEAEWVGHRSPRSRDELLGADLDLELGWLLTYDPPDFDGPSRSGLLDEVTATVAASPEWGLSLARKPVGSGALDSDLWESLFGAWEGKALVDEGPAGLLGLLEQHPRLFYHSRSVARFLLRMTETPVPEETLGNLAIAERASDGLFAACRSEPFDEEFETAACDWLMTAINHPGGMLGKFWLKALTARRRLARDQWVGLPGGYRVRFGLVLSEDTPVAAMGRVVLASQLHFLFALDATWATENIVPLFDWSRDARRAEQSWHGFLTWGRIDEALLPDLLPLYEQTFSRLEAISSHHRGLCMQLAGIAVHAARDPIEDGWLASFIPQADDELRSEWARAVTAELRRLSPEATQLVWERWIDQYWSLRLQGIPALLLPGEARELLIWAVALRGVFYDAVARVLVMPPVDIDAGHVLFEIDRTSLPEEHPAEVARLVRHILPASSQPFYACPEVEAMIKRLLAAGAPRETLTDICRVMGNLGCSNALALRDFIAESEGDG